MTKRLIALFEELKARPLLAAVVVVFATGAMVAAGFYSYRTYDFIEHDNDFCMSCHLMEEPFEEFGRSAHRGLGCKACHQPSLIGRSRMALTQIVEQPTELETHAEVPNERCAECHVEGDPDRWETIRNSAGHLVHLDSDAPELSGLRCVQCHSSSVHEFSATDRTCGQSDCHDDTTIQLGRMGDFTIHCTACHGFSSPVAGQERGGGAEAAEAGREALRPGEGTCLSCHAMRALVDLPEDDPHEAECAACHNPHEQTEPVQAVQNCSSSDCHSGIDELSGFHHGLAPETAEGCMACHNAHDFHLDGSDCRSCHEDVLRDGPPPASRADTTFYHSQHVDVSCLDCHSTEGDHGTSTVTSITDCRSCHHQEPVVGACMDCHQTAEFPPEPFERIHEMAFEVVAPRDRALPFDHVDHTSEGCESCHTADLTLSSAGTSCSSCHEDHHEPEVACRRCHEEAPAKAHPAEVHVGCSGAGCHEPTPFDAVPRTREFCLSCHQDLVEHKQDSDQECAECHTLPEPRLGGGGGGGGR